MAAAQDRRPVREVVAVVIRIVEEPTLFHDQLASVDAHLAAVPPDRPRAGRLFDRRHGPLDRLALLVPVHLVVVAPPIAMADDFVAPPHELLRYRRVALEGHRRAKARDGNPRRVEDPKQSPDAGS